jgi:WD40 repeat protein
VAAVGVAALLPLACGGGSDDGAGSTGGTASPTPASALTATGEIAFVDANHNLAIVEADSRAKRTLTDGGGVESVSWSPDGSRLALVGEFGVRVLAAGGDTAFEMEGATHPVWSPQGELLAVVDGNSVGVYDMGGSRVLEVPDAATGAWSPGGETLAVSRQAAEGGVPILVDVISGEERPLSDQILSDREVFPMTWEPSGVSVAYRDGLYDAVTGERENLPGSPVYWSPDGRRLLVTLDFDPQSKSTAAQLLVAADDWRPVIGLDIRESADDTPPWQYIQRWTAWTADSRYLIYLDPDPNRLRVRIYDTVEVRMGAGPGRVRACGRCRGFESSMAAQLAVVAVRRGAGSGGG